MEQGKTQDRVGSAIRDIWSSGAWAYGALVGLGVLLVAGSILFLLGLIPSRSWQVFVGAKYYTAEPVTMLIRVSRAALTSWSIQANWTQSQSGSHGHGTYWGVSAAGVLVLLGLTWVAGRIIRWRVPASLMLRGGALFTFAVTCAVFAGILAASTSYKITDAGSSMSYRQAPFTYALSALVLAALLGAFSFGVVGLLRRSVSVALRQAGWLVLVTYVLAAAVFPLFVVANAVPQAKTTDGLVYAAMYSPSVASMTVPAALGAALDVGNKDLGGDPFATYPAGSTKTAYHWPGLVRVMFAHPASRLTTYAAAFGAYGGVLAIGLSVGLLAVFAWLTTRLCRMSGARTAVAGLRFGVLQGACLALLLVPVVPLSRFGDVWNYGKGSSGTSIWGVPWTSLLYSSLLSLAVGGIVGIVYASLRPSRVAAAVRAPAVASGQPFQAPTRQPDVFPDQAQAAPSQGGGTAVKDSALQAAYCQSCGAAFDSDEAAFCALCGKPRSRIIQPG